MSRCNTLIAAALAAAALAAPAALAQPADIHAPLVKANKQDLRSPDTRDARATPSGPHAGRPETAGNPDVISAADRALAQERYYTSYGKHAATDAGVTPAADPALAQERYYMSHGKHAATDAGVTPAADSALAQERYYASHGSPTPLTDASRTVASDTGEGIALLPFVVAVFGALMAGLGAGSRLHLLHARRRHGTRLAT